MATTNQIGATCPPAATTVDFVGYGNQADCAEGSPTPSLSATTAATRWSQGCEDTINNAADFTVGSPTPGNSSQPPPVCPLSTLKWGSGLRRGLHPPQRGGEQHRGDARS